MKNAIIMILLASLAFGGAAYGVKRLHGEALALEKAARDMTDAIEAEKKDEALVLAQWSYQRLKQTKSFWDTFVEHTNTDEILILLAEIQSAIKYGDLPSAHKASRVLSEKLQCLDKDCLLSVGNLF